MDTHTLVVLGAEDPEMQAIESLLNAAGVPVAYASPDLHRRLGGPATPSRVTPANAYATRSFVWPEGRFIPPGVWYPRVMVAVECGFPEPGTECSPAELEWWGHGGSADPEVITFDHHRPGDPGHGRPPADYLPASSIGQVVSWLAREGLWFPGEPLPNASKLTPGTFWPAGQGWCVAGADGHDYAVPDDLLFTAASDHCLAAAYAGECWGVDPGELRDWRAERVLTQRDGSGRPGSRSVEEVAADLRKTESVIADMVHREHLEPALNAHQLIGGHLVLDLRGVGTLPDIPEVACMRGFAYLADAPGRPGEPPKVVLGGCGEGTVPGTGPVEAFIGGWAEEHGLERPYGSAVRGFAGAYVKQ